MSKGGKPEDRLRQARLGAFFRPQQLEAAGVSYGALQGLVRAGIVEHVNRGLYRVAEAETTEHYSLSAVCARAPGAIICLRSALRVHGLGTQLPAGVWLAIPNKARPPRIRGIKVRIVRFSGAALSYGVERTEFEGVPARITNPARTLVDCFRYERRVGREISMEALREALRLRKVTTDAIYRTLGVLPSRRLRSVLEAMAP